MADAPAAPAGEAPAGEVREAEAPAAQRLPWLDTLLYALALSGFPALVAVAALLVPEPSGVGTHTQLHLPPCGVWLVFGKPCPSCGMTTAFAWMAKGHWVRGFRTQPAGGAVFLAALGWWVYAGVAALRRRPFGEMLESKAFLPTVLGLIALILGVWGWRLASG